MRGLVIALVASAGLWLAVPVPAQAGTIFLDESFGAGWTPGTDWIITTGSTYSPQIVTDGAQTPASALRLTPATTNQNAAIIYALPQPTRAGLDISFRQSQWGGDPAADGIAFFLQKGTETSTRAGALGGALGYSTEHQAGRDGLPGGLLGVGLDRFGNFSNPIFGGSDCGDSDPGLQPNSVTLRGPGDGGTTGYCRLGIATGVDFGAAAPGTRSSNAVSVRVTVDPSTEASPQVKVWVCDVATRCDVTTAPTLSVAAPAALLAEATFRFGFSAGTGGFTNNHDIWDLQVGS